jgi:hypothetical protein
MVFCCTSVAFSIYHSGYFFGRPFLNLFLNFISYAVYYFLVCIIVFNLVSSDSSVSTVEKMVEILTKVISNKNVLLFLKNKSDLFFFLY